MQCDPRLFNPPLISIHSVHTVKKLSANLILLQLTASCDKNVTLTTTAKVTYAQLNKLMTTDNKVDDNNNTNTSVVNSGRLGPSNLLLAVQ